MGILFILVWVNMGYLSGTCYIHRETHTDTDRWGEKETDRLAFYGYEHNVFPS